MLVGYGTSIRVGTAFQLMLFLKTIHKSWNGIPVDVVSKNNT